MGTVTLKQLLAWRGEPLTTADCAVTAVTADSRRVTPGCLFVCIRGEKFDGHKAAGEALENGAAAVVCERDLGLKRQIRVKNSREAFARICAAYFGDPADSLKIIGVTGTNGKSTTCFLVRDILERAGHKAGLLGTVKTDIGGSVRESSLTTPEPFELHGLFREMADAGCEYCVMEVSSIALDQQRVAGITFEAAIYTNLTQDHLDYHKTMENYKKAKQKLFANAKRSIVNADDAAAADMLMSAAGETRTFSQSCDNADFTAKNIKLGAAQVAYELVGNGVIGRILYGVPGGFSVSNSMGAAICALALEVPLTTVQEAIAETTVTGRLEPVQIAADYTVLIDYAHTPDALENVLSALKESTQGRVIAVFGCGGDRDRGKRPLMGEIASRLADIAVVTSDNPRSEEPLAIIGEICKGIPSNAPGIHIEPDRRAAIAWAMREAQAGDVVLLAGKGQETYQILASGKIHFDEREIVRETAQKEQ